MELTSISTRDIAANKVNPGDTFAGGLGIFLCCIDMFFYAVWSFFENILS